MKYIYKFLIREPVFLIFIKRSIRYKTIMKENDS